MENKINFKSIYGKSFIVLGIVWLVYAVLSLLAPPVEAMKLYDLTLSELNTIRLSISIPLLLIWAAALYGFLGLKKYSILLVEGVEKKAVSQISTGILVLIFGLILPSIIGFFAAFNPDNFIIEKYVAITTNTVNIFILLIANLYFFFGTQKLINSLTYVNKKSVIIRNLTSVGISVILAALFLNGILSNEYRTTSNNPDFDPTFYLSDFWILLTVFIPGVISWYFGISAIINNIILTKNVKGILFKRFYKLLGGSITAVMALSISLRFIEIGHVFTGLSIFAILLIVYAILIVMAIAYVLIAIAAKKLSKIETV